MHLALVTQSNPGPARTKLTLTDLQPKLRSKSYLIRLIAMPQLRP